jgi:hypothetical protein
MPWLDRNVDMPEGLVMGKGHTFFLRKIIGAATISNSEVGQGGLSLLPGIFEEQCTNLATFRKEGTTRIHVGKKVLAEDTVSEFLSDETRKLDDAALWSRVRDQAKALMDGRILDAIVQKLVAARGRVIEGDPAKVVEVFAKQRQLTQDESGGLLRHLVGSGEMTQYGLQWALTRLSQDVVSYDRATDFERMGGEVIELGAQDWKQLAKAA